MKPACGAALWGAALASLLLLPLRVFAEGQGAAEPSSAVPEAQASSQALPAASAVKPAAPPSQTELLSSDLSAAVSAFEKFDPAALEGFSEKDRERVLASFVKALAPGAELLPSDAKPSEPFRRPRSPGQPCLPGVMIAGNKIFYIRLNELSKEAAELLAEECAPIGLLARRPQGVVLDLRDCFGSDLSLLPSFLSALNVKDANGLPLDFRLAVLTGGRTSGSAEALAAALEHERRGVAIGYPTEGRPFPVKSFAFGSWRVAAPDVPVGLSYVRQAPFAPSIEARAYPQIDIQKLRSTLGSEDSDLCLSRAVDLLVSLDAINRKWKKTVN